MSPCRLHWEADGPDDAPALVLLGSIGSTVAMWEPNVTALAEAHWVVRADHRGHGASPVPPGPYALADLGADVLALLDRLGLDRASVCGLSLGGMVAMWLAAHAPGRVERLALLCTSSRMDPETWRSRAAAVRALGTVSIAEAVVGRWFTPAFAAAHPVVVARMHTMVASISSEGYAGCCAAIENMTIDDDLGRIAAPTLVVAGAGDPATPPEHGERIAEAIPGARLEVVPGAAHLASWEQAETVTRLVLDHVNGGSGP